MRAFQIAIWVTLGGAVLGVGFLLGRASTPRRSPPVASPVTPETTERPTAPAPAQSLVRALRRLPVLPAAGGASGAEDPELAETRSKRAHRLFANVFRRLEIQKKGGFNESEARVMSVVPYLDGLIHGALEADPAMRGAFAEAFTSSLCGGELGDDEAGEMAYTALMLPDIPTSQGFDCFFAKGKEGFAFWTMLDAWRHSGLKETPILADIHAKATDPRTVRRFAAPEDSAPPGGAWPTAVGTIRDPIASH